MSLEADLRRPVLTANQVLLWGALRAADARPRIDHYGRIFDLHAAPPRGQAHAPDADAIGASPTNNSAVT
jgi:hypothetical protein